MLNWIGNGSSMGFGVTELELLTFELLAFVLFHTEVSEDFTEEKEKIIFANRYLPTPRRR